MLLLSFTRTCRLSVPALTRRCPLRLCRSYRRRCVLVTCSTAWSVKRYYEKRLLGIISSLRLYTHKCNSEVTLTSLSPDDNIRLEMLFWLQTAVAVKGEMVQMQTFCPRKRRYAGHGSTAARHHKHQKDDQSGHDSVDDCCASGLIRSSREVQVKKRWKRLHNKIWYP